MVLDIVCPVRPGDDNEELRYSIRSIEANFPHGRIWIVGYKPSWLTDVEFIEGNKRLPPRGNVYANILLACQHPGVPEQFVIFNDDIFVTSPVDAVPTYYRGTLAAHLALPGVKMRKTWWSESLTTTMACLQTLGIESPISYELHVPLPTSKTLMRRTLERFVTVTTSNPPQWRTLYGNLNQIGGSKCKDSKVMSQGALRTPFHSTTDVSWRYFRRRFEDLFPEPSRYEIPVMAKSGPSRQGNRAAV